jgi:hypothetical protein
MIPPGQPKHWHDMARTLIKDAWFNHVSALLAGQLRLRGGLNGLSGLIWICCPLSYIMEGRNVPCK